MAIARTPTARRIRASGGRGRVAQGKGQGGRRSAKTRRERRGGRGRSPPGRTERAIARGGGRGMGRGAGRPPVCCCRRYRYSAPGVDTTLYSRFVGVTA